MSNTELQPVSATSLTPKMFFEQDLIKKKFAEILGKRSTSFVTSVLQIINSNDLLKNATSESIYHSAMVAATLDLPLNNNLGFAYIVPYSQSYKDEQNQWQKKTVAQFQMGYKGFIQLVQRTGQCKSIYASEIYEGQLISENPLDGFEFDFSKKTSDKIIGYACRLRLLNGFESTYYMTTEKVSAHATKFSQTFKSGKGVWKDDFDSMAKKTVTKLLLSKYAPMSVELQRAVIADQAIINDVETMDVDYVDNTPKTIEDTNNDKEIQRVKDFIAKAKDRTELLSVVEYCEEHGLLELYNARINEITNGTK